MKSIFPFFREAKRSSEAKGESTGDEDFTDEAGDDAAAEEGESELDDEGDEVDGPATETEDDEQSDEDEDDDEEESDEEEAEEDEPEEETSAEFKFKNESGDFDFKRINKAVGGDALEKAFKEQNATITRTFQELKVYKDQIPNHAVLQEKTNKAGFLDDMMNSNPVIKAEVLRVLHGGQPAAVQNNLVEDFTKIPGLNPKDPLIPILQQLQQQNQTLANRQAQEDRQRQQQEVNRRFFEGLQGGKAKFKELTGKEPSPEQVAMLDNQMRQSNFFDSQQFVPHMFMKEIQESWAKKQVSQRKVKKNLPKVTGTRRPSSKKTVRSKNDDREELWNKHMGDSQDD